jgi:hypothetical protein
VKVARAKALFLDAPWASVRSIGIAVGYPDLTTFGCAFKRYEGITPRLYREIAGDLAGWRPSVSSRVRRSLMYGIAHLAYLSPAAVPLLIDLANLLHRFGNGSQPRSPGDRRGDLE